MTDDTERMEWDMHALAEKVIAGIFFATLACLLIEAYVTRGPL